jgi:uncharacterized protein (DUF488 family)
VTTIYTIGYEGADPDRFVAALRGAGVAAVADVRAVALSRKRGFSKNQLRQNLAEADIGYRHFIDLGTPRAGRDAARAGDAARMRKIFCEQLATDGAQAALDELADMAADQPVCLLCFERDPAQCHRRVVAERLGERGFTAVDLFVI